MPNRNPFEDFVIGVFAGIVATGLFYVLTSRPIAQLQECERCRSNYASA